MDHINSLVVVMSVVTAIFAPHGLLMFFTTPRNPESESPEFDYR
jgi:hypothetical protein